MKVERTNVTFMGDAQIGGSGGDAGKAGAGGAGGAGGTAGTGGNGGGVGNGGGAGNGATGGGAGEEGTAGIRGGRGTPGGGGSGGSAGNGGTGHPDGSDGKKGLDGTSGDFGAYGATANDGAVGTGGDNSNSGTIGPNGNTAAQGASGVAGNTAAGGTAGTAGKKGGDAGSVELNWTDSVFTFGGYANIGGNGGWGGSQGGNVGKIDMFLYNTEVNFNSTTTIGGTGGDSSASGTGGSTEKIRISFQDNSILNVNGTLTIGGAGGYGGVEGGSTGDVELTVLDSELNVNNTLTIGGAGGGSINKGGNAGGIAVVLTNSLNSFKDVAIGGSGGNADIGTAGSTGGNAGDIQIDITESTSTFNGAVAVGGSGGTGDTGGNAGTINLTFTDSNSYFTSNAVFGGSGGEGFSKGGNSGDVTARFDNSLTIFMGDATFGGNGGDADNDADAGKAGNVDLKFTNTSHTIFQGNVVLGGTTKGDGKSFVNVLVENGLCQCDNECCQDPNVNAVCNEVCHIATVVEFQTDYPSLVHFATDGGGGVFQINSGRVDIGAKTFFTAGDKTEFTLGENGTLRFNVDTYTAISGEKTFGIGYVESEKVNLSANLMLCPIPFMTMAVGVYTPSEEGHKTMDDGNGNYGVIVRADTDQLVAMDSYSVSNYFFDADISRGGIGDNAAVGELYDAIYVREINIKNTLSHVEGPKRASETNSGYLLSKNEAAMCLLMDNTDNRREFVENVNLLVGRTTSGMYTAQMHRFEQVNKTILEQRLSPKMYDICSGFEEEQEHTWVLWASGYAMDGSRSYRHFDPRLEFEGWGGIIGGEYNISCRTTLGLYFAYGQTDLTSRAPRLGGTYMESDDFTVGVYGRWQSLFMRGYTALMGNYTHNNMYQERFVGVGTDIERFSSKFDGSAWGLYFEKGWDWYWNYVRVSPYAALQYQRLTMDGYDEGGPCCDSAFALRVADSHVESFRLLLGFRTHTQVLDWLQLSCDLGYVHEYNKDGAMLHTTFSEGTYPTARIMGIDLGRNWVNLGLGAHIQFSDYVKLYINYDLAAGSSTSHLGMGTVELRY